MSPVCRPAERAAAAGRTGVPATAAAAQADENAPKEDAMPATPADPYLWLEDVTGDKQLAWVREQNARTEAELAGAPGFDKLESDILAVPDSDPQNPSVGKPGRYYSTFWPAPPSDRGTRPPPTPDKNATDNPTWKTPP